MNDSSASRAVGAPAGRATRPDARSGLPAAPEWTDAQRLARIRALHAGIAPGRHAVAWDGDGALIIADGPKGEKYEIARLLPIASNDERDFLGEAAEAVRFLLDLLDRAARKVRELGGDAAADRPPGVARPAGGAGGAAAGAPREANYAAEAAIKCGEPAFKAFLIEKHGLEKPATDERTAQRLRTLLKITSRAELNADADAAARWKALRGDFENWKRAG